MVVLGRLLMDDTIEGLRQTIRGYRGYWRMLVFMLPMLT